MYFHILESQQQKVTRKFFLWCVPPHENRILITTAGVLALQQTFTYQICPNPTGVEFSVTVCNFSCPRRETLQAQVSMHVTGKIG